MHRDWGFISYHDSQDSAAFIRSWASCTVDEFEELLARIRTGDKRALDKLLARWRPILRRTAHGKLRRSTVARADTSDIVQNALLDAAGSIIKFRGTSEAEWATWLKTILTRQACKLHRFHHTQKRTVQREESSLQDSYASITDSATSSLEDIELDELNQAINVLPSTMKEIVFRRLVKREPYELIAHELQITCSNARVQFTRAIRMLREHLDKT